MTKSPPRIRIVSDNPHFDIEVRILGWAELRRIVRQAECECTESRVGWFTKKFTVIGTQAQLQQFIDIAWWSEVLGPSLQDEVLNER